MIIDSHCHLDFADFDTDRDQLLDAAADIGVSKIIIPGVQRSHWQRQIKIQHSKIKVYNCFGLHPYFIDQHSDEDLQQLDSWCQSHPVIAIGECGLDFFVKTLDREQQQQFFEAQLDIALHHQLPVVIHARKSTEAVIQALQQRPGLRGMIHSYSGSYEQAVKLIDMGFYLSFGGPVTYTGSSKLRKLVSRLPLECLLIETDAPDQPVYQHRGERHEPAHIRYVIESIAELQQTDIEHVIQQTADNANTLFQLV